MALNDQTAPQEQENPDIKNGPVPEEKNTAEKAAKPERSDKSEKKIKKLEADLAEKNDAYLRLAAEYDNFRKRTAKEKLGAAADAKAEVLKDLLPVIDNFERAEKSTSDQFEDYKKGMDMTYDQFNAALEKLGVEAYGEENDPFDPLLHNAVMHEDNEEYGQGVIMQVLQKGYKAGGKVIRPAMVKVAN